MPDAARAIEFYIVLFKLVGRQREMPNIWFNCNNRNTSYRFVGYFTYETHLTNQFHAQSAYKLYLHFRKYIFDNLCIELP